MLKRLLTARAAQLTKRRVAIAESLLGGNGVCMLDVGAAEGAPSRWYPYASLVNYVAVEPDPRSVSALKGSESDGFRSRHVVTQGLWSHSGHLDLHLCRKPMASSIYMPNHEFASRFPDAERFEVVGRESMHVTTIDDLAESNSLRFDAIKLDVQGAEYEVIRGASTSLASVLAIECEIEFAELYLGQPLADQVTGLISSHGLDLLDYLYLYRWHPEQFDGTGQLVFADALYMRAPESLAESGEVVQRRFAALAVIYGRGDMLVRLARVVRDPETRRLIADAAAVVNSSVRKSNALLQKAARLARLNDDSARVHLFQ